MKDKWMNIGYEDDDLKPFIEPLPDINDPMRIGNEVTTKDALQLFEPLISLVQWLCTYIFFF